MTTRPTRIATLPVGYGDGWRRALSDRADALVRGVRVPLVGRVAMDAVMADVTDVPGAPVTEDDEFVLLGAQGAERITALELASACGTISYEIVTGMSRRLARVYHAAGSAIGSADAHGWEVRVTRIELWNGDICDLEVDAIVSPATTSLWMSTGIAGEIKRAGGDAIEFAAIRQAPAALGDAIVTPAGRLAARVVIHAVSLERDRRTSGPAIDRAARSAMARVRELRPRQRRLPGPRDRDRRLPAGRGRPHRRDGRSRRAGGRRRRSSTSSSPCAEAPPTRRSRTPSRRTSPRRPGRCSSPGRPASGRPRPARRRAAPAPTVPAAPATRAGVSFSVEPLDERREALVEAVAREIRLRGLTGPAVHFLEASRPYRPLGAPAMLFFDPVLRDLFGGESPSATELLRDDVGIEALIDRLEELDEVDGWDA